MPGPGAHLPGSGIFHSLPHASSITSWGAQLAVRREPQEQRGPMLALGAKFPVREDDAHGNGT